jgi:hypothetical protein
MDTETMSKADLLAKIEKGWNDFQTYLKTLSEEQLTGPADAAGWTAKDHIMHLAVWEDSINALFNSQLRNENMGVDKATWDSRDFDKINAVIQQRHKDKPLAEVLQTLQDVHQRLMTKLQSLTEEDLTRPYSHYQSDSTNSNPAIRWVKGDTYEHYAEHTPWIDAIVKQA